MGYRLLADLVLFVHASFAVFVVLGGLLVLRRPRVAWIHVPAALWGAGIEIVGGICPLTPLENHLRELAGQQAYPGDFVAHYVLQLLYPEGLTQPVQLLLGAGVLVVNAMLYGAILWGARSSRS